jgi:hypothetical protein
VTLIQDIVLSATTCTYSVYAKKSTGATDANRFTLRNNTTATNLLAINFNYDTGVITYSTGSSGATATNVGNGWWRIELTVSSGITSGNTLRLYAGFVGVDTSGQAAFFWQAQLEAGTGASSPIPTTTAAVTRAADVPNLTGLTLSAAYTLVAEGICPTLVSGNFPAMLGFTGSVGISVAGSNGAPGANMGGATYNSSFGALRTAGQSVNLAFRAETNNANGAGNGTLGAVDTSFTPTTGAITNFYFGLSSSAVNPWNSTISRIRIYNRALPDAQLQSLTT